jgi:hypothetical protein
LERPALSRENAAHCNFDRVLVWKDNSRKGSCWEQQLPKGIVNDMTCHDRVWKASWNEWCIPLLLWIKDAMSAPYHKPQARLDRELLRHLHRRLASSTIPVPLHGETYGKWHARMMADLTAVRQADAEAHRKEYGPWNSWEYQEWYAQQQDLADGQPTMSQQTATSAAEPAPGGSNRFPLGVEIGPAAGAGGTNVSPHGGTVPAHGDAAFKTPVPPMLGTFGAMNGAN